MQLKEKGRYAHFTSSLLVVNENESYDLISHVYVMQDGVTFTKYEKKENEFYKIVKLRNELNKNK